MASIIEHVTAADKARIESQDLLDAPDVAPAEPIDYGVLETKEEPR